LGLLVAVAGDCAADTSTASEVQTIGRPAWRHRRARGRRQVARCVLL